MTENVGVQGGDAERAVTGIAGLDAILGGGLPRSRSYLVQGDNGSGKTTLGLQFCMAGAQHGEAALYLATCESEQEIRQIARSHNWGLDGVTLHCHDVREIFGEHSAQSVFHPAEVELPETVDALLSIIERVNPERLVIDSLSEIRLLAANPRWFHHHILALKQYLANRRCTTLLCDARSPRDQPVNSIVHGVIELEQVASNYGPDLRRLRIAKLRGQQYASGYHDFKIRTGGFDVFPRLIAAEHRHRTDLDTSSSGLAELDTMFGGGIDRGTATLLLGPSGTGKSNLVVQFAVAAADRQERSVMYVFDERIQTLLGRAEGLGLGLERQVERELVELRQIDPSELTPGEFSQEVRRAVVERNTRLVIIDSLTGFVQAMPDERSLLLHLHELISYLSQQGVAVLLVLTEHGLPGSLQQAPIDLSYIADSVLLFHSFEYAGEVRKAISVYKRRGGAHEQTLRELQFGAEGIHIGQPLRRFQGVLTGMPRFIGEGLSDAHTDNQS